MSDAWALHEEFVEYIWSDYRWGLFLDTAGSIGGHLDAVKVRGKFLLDDVFHLPDVCARKGGKIDVSPYNRLVSEQTIKSLRDPRQANKRKNVKMEHDVEGSGVWQAVQGGLGSNERVGLGRLKGEHKVYLENSSFVIMPLLVFMQGTWAGSGRLRFLLLPPSLSELHLHLLLDAAIFFPGKVVDYLGIFPGSTPAREAHS